MTMHAPITHNCLGTVVPMHLALCVLSVSLKWAVGLNLSETATQNSSPTGISSISSINVRIPSSNIAKMHLMYTLDPNGNR